MTRIKKLPVFLEKDCKVSKTPKFSFKRMSVLIIHHQKPAQINPNRNNKF